MEGIIALSAATRSGHPERSGCGAKCSSHGVEGPQRGIRNEECCKAFAPRANENSGTHRAGNGLPESFDCVAVAPRS